MNKVIVIIGTPGVGKSTLAIKLAKQLKWKRLDLHEHYKEISTGYDKSGKCYIIDIKKLEKLVKKESKENNLIIDSHVAHLLPKKLVDLCIILTCDLKILNKRLIKRGYGKKKVRENLDAEIFQVCLEEANTKRHKVLEIESSKVDLGKIVKLIK